MLSLTEMRRAVRILDSTLSGAVLERIAQPDEYAIVLTFNDPVGTHNLLLTCRPEFARISLLESPPEAPRAPLAFAQFLRAHFRRARSAGVRILGDDRQAAIALKARDGACEVVLSILGPRSNIYLLDEKAMLVQCMRPLERTRRDLELGRPFVNPASAVKSEGADRWAGEPDESYLQTIERTYGKLEQEKRFEDRSRRISHALAKETAFLERKTRNLQADLASASKAEEYRRQGELLKSVFHQIRPGADAVEATDTEAGQQVTIALDPRLSAAANLQQYFDRYHKELRKEEEIGKQLEALQASRASTAELDAKFRAVLDHADPDLQALESFESIPRVQRLLARHYSERKPAASGPRIVAGKKKAPGRLQPKRYRSVDGLEIWVGRNDAGNDLLTTRLSRGNDLFFHLEGWPGSHVVLRTEGRKDPPSESLLDACELAVHFSKQKNANRVDIHVASIKDVRKPPGAKAGLVYVARGKTIHLRRDPKRLERLLASRLDE